jgi:hypothetical protein
MSTMDQSPNFTDMRIPDLEQVMWFVVPLSRTHRWWLRTSSFSRFRRRRAPSTARLGCAPAPNLRSSATSHSGSTVAAVSAELPLDNWNRGGRRGNFLNRCGTHQEQRAHLLQLQPHEPFPSSRACSSNPWPNGLSCHNWCSELAPPPLVPASLHPSCMTCSVSCHPCRSQTRLPCQISHRSWDVRATPVRAMSRSTKCNLETQRRSVPVRAMSWGDTECKRDFVLLTTRSIFWFLIATSTKAKTDSNRPGLSGHITPAHDGVVAMHWTRMTRRVHAISRTTQAIPEDALPHGLACVRAHYKLELMNSNQSKLWLARFI